MRKFQSAHGTLLSSSRATSNRYIGLLCLPRELREAVLYILKQHFISRRKSNIYTAGEFI